MGTPTVTVNATLAGSADAGEIQGSVDVALCGYGSMVPRVNGSALVARITTASLPADTNGKVSFQLAGNDYITPAGTYYTVVVRDENGDIAQVNAYQFLGGQTYDLNSTDPYDPNLPPPPLPVPITNELEVLPAAGNMVFDGTNYTAFKTTISGPVDFATIQNMQPGNLYTFIIVQDSVGNNRFTWPPGIHNATAICPIANATTIQTFVADETGQLYSIAPGTVYL